MKIIPLEPSSNLICEPCWLSSQRDTTASVAIETTDPFGCTIRLMCGNHAELLDGEIEFVEEEERG